MKKLSKFILAVSIIGIIFGSSGVGIFSDGKTPIKHIPPLNKQNNI